MRRDHASGFLGAAASGTACYVKPDTEPGTAHGLMAIARTPAQLSRCGQTDAESPGRGGARRTHLQESDAHRSRAVCGDDLMRVLHVSAGNLYGGVETVLVTLARCRALDAPRSTTSSRCAMPGGRRTNCARLARRYIGCR